MQLSAMADWVGRIRQEPLIRSEVAKGNFAAIEAVGLSGEEKKALSLVARRMEGRSETPAYLLRDPNLPIWF